MATQYNLSIDAGATFNLDFEYLDAGGDPVDLTGYTAKFQIRNTPEDELVLQKTPTITPLTGIIGLSLSATETGALDRDAYLWGITLTLGFTVIRLIEGYVYVAREIVKH
jgi:hypothetical protein